MSVTFETCVMEAFRMPELMSEYRRLTGATLGVDNRLPLVRAIDEATGHDPQADEWPEFFRFVRDCVWLPLLFEARDQDSMSKEGE